MLPLDLSIEQEANLAIYRSQVPNLSREQAQEMLLNMMCQIMVKDNVIRHLMKSAL